MRSPRTVFGVVAALVASGIATFIVVESDVALLPALLLGANVAAFLLYGLDKATAKWGPEHGEPGGWRVPEVVLLALAALGGALGAWAAMHVFRHKTQKRAFAWGVPALLALEAAGLGWAWHAGLIARLPG